MLHTDTVGFLRSGYSAVNHAASFLFLAILSEFEMSSEMERDPDQKDSEESKMVTLTCEGDKR